MAFDKTTLPPTPRAFNLPDEIERLGSVRNHLFDLMVKLEGAADTLLGFARAPDSDEPGNDVSGEIDRLSRQTDEMLNLLRRCDYAATRISDCVSSPMSHKGGAMPESFYTGTLSGRG